MNVRVLLLMAACVLSTGCCMPGVLMNPSMMQCCPVGNIGARPMMNAAACNPPQFRSSHSNLVTTRFQSPQPFSGFASFAQPALAMNVCCPQPLPAPQPVCPQPVYQQHFQLQPICTPPPLQYAPRYCAPKASVPAKPWKLPWSFGSFPRFGGSKAVSQRWIPDENHRSISRVPCGESGCGEEVYRPPGTSFHFQGDDCGEEVPYFSMAPQKNARLTPVPAPPSVADVRYFSNSGEKRTAPVRSQTAAFDPPPAAEKLPDPPDIELDDPEVDANQAPMNPPVVDLNATEGDAAPALNPAASNEVNPFEDVEDLTPEVALPVEADIPQAILLVPKPVYPPLHIPATEVCAPEIVTVASQTVTPWMPETETETEQAIPFIASPQVVRAAETVRATGFVQQLAQPKVVPPLEMPWQPIELQEGFFGQDESPQLRRTQQQPVRSQASSRQRIQHKVIHRATVDEAEQLVPISRVISRRRQ